jgi:hypothetical protein
MLLYVCFRELLDSNIDRDIEWILTSLSITSPGQCFDSASSRRQPCPSPSSRILLSVFLWRISITDNTQNLGKWTTGEMIILSYLGSRYSSGLRAGIRKNFGSFPEVTSFFGPELLPDRLWGPANFLFFTYYWRIFPQGVKWLERETDDWLSSNAEINNIVTWCPKAGIVKLREASIPRQLLCKHIPAATNTQATIE